MEKNKKKYRVESTPAQIATFNDIMEQKAKGKRVNKGAALKKAGYSKSIQKAPSVVLESRGYKQLVEDKIPQNKLIDYLRADLEVVDGPARLPIIKYIMELHGVNTNSMSIGIHDDTDQELIKLKALIDSVEKKEKNE